MDLDFPPDALPVAAARQQDGRSHLAVGLGTDAVDLDPIASLFDADPRFRVAYDQLAAPTDSPFAVRPALGPQREVRQVIVDAIAQLYSDPEGADAAALLADAAETANRLIANYNDLN